MRCSRLQMSPVRTLLLFCVVYCHSVFAHTSAEHIQVLHWPAMMHGGDHLQFTLVAHNSAGERIWHGGDSYFVSLYGPGGTITPTAPIDNLDGTYSVSTRLMEAGTHQLCTVLHSTGWPDPHFHPTRCASTQRNPCNHSAARFAEAAPCALQLASRSTLRVTVQAAVVASTPRCRHSGDVGGRWIRTSEGCDGRHCSGKLDSLQSCGRMCENRCQGSVQQQNCFGATEDQEGNIDYECRLRERAQYVWVPFECHYHLFDPEQAATCLRGQTLLFMDPDTHVESLQFGGGLGSTVLLRTQPERCVIRSCFQDFARISCTPIVVGTDCYLMEALLPENSNHERCIDLITHDLAQLSDRLRLKSNDLSEVKWYGDSVHAFGRNLKLLKHPPKRLLLRTSTMTAPFFHSCDVTLPDRTNGDRARDSSEMSQIYEMNFTKARLHTGCSGYYQRLERMQALNDHERAVARDLGVDTLDLALMSRHGQSHWYDDLVHFDGRKASLRSSCRDDWCAVVQKMMIQMLLNTLCDNPTQIHAQ